MIKLNFLLKIKKASFAIVFAALLLLFIIFSGAAPCLAAKSAEKTTPHAVRYILLKAVDADSSRAVNSAAVTINKRLFFSTSPSGLIKVDLHSKELAGFDFLDIHASREGYFEASLEVSVKNPAKIPQPVKIKMKQKMGVLTGVITGCWSDKDGHYIDSYSNEQIKVFGKALSSQHIIYKFNADKDGNLAIFNLPVGTYEIEIRHKKWPVHINSQGEEIDLEFNIRKCNREEYHRNDKNKNLNKDAKTNVKDVKSNTKTAKTDKSSKINDEDAESNAGTTSKTDKTK